MVFERLKIVYYPTDTYLDLWLNTGDMYGLSMWNVRVVWKTLKRLIEPIKRTLAPENLETERLPRRPNAVCIHNKFKGWRSMITFGTRRLMTSETQGFERTQFGKKINGRYRIRRSNDFWGEHPVLMKIGSSSDAWASPRITTVCVPAAKKLKDAPHARFQ